MRVRDDDCVLAHRIDASRSFRESLQEPFREPARAFHNFPSCFQIRKKTSYKKLVANSWPAGRYPTADFATDFATVFF